MSEEPDSLILRLLRDMRADMTTKVDMDAFRLEVREAQANLASEMKSLRADVASDIHNLDHKIDKTRKDLSEQVVGLRRTMMEYHSSVIGHGIIISELEARVRRVEQHLNLPPAETH